MLPSGECTLGQYTLGPGSSLRGLRLPACLSVQHSYLQLSPTLPLVLGSLCEGVYGVSRMAKTIIKSQSSWGSHTHLAHLYRTQLLVKHQLLCLIPSTLR